MRTIGAMMLNWNGERFVEAHIKMLLPHVDKMIVLQGSSPWPKYKEKYNLSDIPDKSEDIIRQKFPQIEIHNAVQNYFTHDIFNQGQKLLSDYNIALGLDYDVFLTKKDLTELIDFIRKDDSLAYRLSNKDCLISYNYNFDHGWRVPEGGDIFALDTRYFYTGLRDVPVKTHTVDWTTMHHFNGWKGKTDEWLKKHKCNGCIKAPQEIRNLFK